MNRYEIEAHWPGFIVADYEAGEDFFEGVAYAGANEKWEKQPLVAGYRVFLTREAAEAFIEKQRESKPA